jgi:hypothetical protein
MTAPAVQLFAAASLPATNGLYEYPGRTSSLNFRFCALNFEPIGDLSRSALVRPGQMAPMVLLAAVLATLPIAASYRHVVMSDCSTEPTTACPPAFTVQPDCWCINAGDIGDCYDCSDYGCSSSFFSTPRRYQCTSTGECADGEMDTGKGCVDESTMSHTATSDAGGYDLVLQLVFDSSGASGFAACAILAVLAMLACKWLAKHQLPASIFIGSWLCWFIWASVTEPNTIGELSSKARSLYFATVVLCTSAFNFLCALSGLLAPFIGTVARTGYQVWTNMPIKQRALGE